MNKHFLFLFFFLFCFIEASASLKCVTCHLRTPSDHCRRGFGICLAQKDEACMSLKIYYNDSLQLSYMVCQRFCNRLSYNFHNRTYVHKCCNRDYCNFKL